MNLKKKIIKILFKIPDPIYFFDQIVNRPGIFNTFFILLNYIKKKNYSFRINIRFNKKNLFFSSPDNFISNLFNFYNLFKKKIYI